MVYSKEMKKLILFVFIFFLSSSSYTFSVSEYVLPYPSSMPGGFLYKLHLVLEQINKYWYFGDFGQFRYNLNQSDKYLVEAKTLFEYKQYLLGYNALEKSDMYFSSAPLYLKNAQLHGKNISEKEEALGQAAKKHGEVLKKMKNTVPAQFTWVGEKAQPITLNLVGAINKSIHIRSSSL